MKLGFERFTVVLAVVVLAGLGAGLTAPAAAAVAPPGWGRLAQTPEGGSSGVLDTVGAGVHAAAVGELWDLGVFEGTECASGGFCWGEPVLREVAAVWIVRVVDGGDGEVAAGGSRFADVDPDGLWAGHVERLAELRVTVGCAVDPARFCPGVQVSRAQMASFLVRAFGLEPAGEAGFGDTAGSGHGGDIDALLAAGVTLGCSADPLLFCPDHLTTRAQMATFLNRARVLGEDPGDSDSSGADGSGSGGSGGTTTTTPPTTTTTPPTTTTTPPTTTTTVPPTESEGPDGVPSAPQNLTVVPDNTWLELTWEPSDSEGDSPITDYVVQVRRIDEPWTHPLQHHVLEASARSHAVPGLDNGVRYAVRVAALNETGAGAWAEAEATPAVAPGVLDPPVQVLASASETAMTVTWRLPAGVDRVNVDDFWLEWKAASEPWALLLGSISLADTRMMWHQDLGLGIGRITGLSQGQRYTVRVAASDGSGTGRWAAEIDVAAAGRPSAVTDLAYTWRDQDLVLWWDQPENDGGSPILNFNLLWTCPLTNCGRNTETVEGTSHVLAAAQLESALHVIGVAAVNQEGESDYESIWVNVRDTPTAPQSLSVEVSGDSVEAVWEHPEADGLAPISEYQLEWKLRSQQWDVAQQEVVDPESTSHAIDSGIEAGMYEFRVTAINRFGAGDASSVVQLTIAEPPGQPTNLVLEADDGRLIAEWAPATAGSLDVVHFVQWKPASQAGWTGASDAEVAVGSAVHTIEGLSNGVSHTVRVRGRSVAGHGPWSSEESGAAAAPAAGDPGDLALEGRHERIVVTWSPPQSPASPVDKYVFQWRLSGESYDTTRQTEVGPNTRKGTVYNLDNNVVYLVRLSAVDADGEVLGTTEASARVVPAREYIERRIVERYEGDYPWIRQTWNVPLNVNVGKATGVYLFITGRAKSESGTVWPSVARGIGYGFTPFSYSSHVTAVHELAHHFTLDVRVADHPAPVAVGWLYVKQLLGGKCKVSEIYPDFLVYVTTNTKQKLGYLKSCSVTSNPPRQEVQDVARSIAQGEMPQWFFDTYTSDGTYATADLDRLWSDIKSTTQKNANGFRFRNMFGGYCSEREAIIALRSSGGPAYKNPWVDGGCETRWPLDLSASAGSSGSIDVSWQEPHYATTPAIDAYLVQWKAAGEQYDSTRQALVTDLTDLSHTITGLTSGAQYSVRLAAVNEDDASDFVDDDGHTRAAETQATAG